MVFIFCAFSSGNAIAQCFTNLNSEYCVDDGVVLISGSCSDYYGPGISGGVSWDPSAAGIGTHTVYGIDGPLTTYTVDQSGTFNPIIPSSTTIIPLTDDFLPGQDALIPIPFNFNFYGSSYSAVTVDNNGFLQFGGRTDDAAVNDALPDSDSPNNIIAAVWDDFDPSAGGTIEYFTNGSSPTRVFGVNFINVPLFSNNSSRATFQIQLHESTNLIEIHSTNVDSDGNPTGRTQGVENIGGTAAVPVPGRNFPFTEWTTTNDYVAFVPDNLSSQSVTVNDLPDNGLALSYDATTICGVETITIDIANSEMGVNYQVFDQTGSVSVSGIETGNNGTLQITTSALSTSVTELILRATNAATGCNSDFASQNITVNPLPNITVSSPLEEICSGESINIVLNNPNTFGNGFYWTVVTNGISGVSAEGSPVSPESSPINQTLTLDDPLVSGTATYTIYAVNSATGCESFLGREVIVTVDPVPVAETDLASYVLCSGENTSIAISEPNALSGTTFNWTSSVLSGSATGASSGNGSTISQALSSTDLSVVEYTITPTLNGCEGSSITREVTVNPLPNLTVNPAAEEICDGETTNIVLGNPNTFGDGFYWTVATSGVIGAGNMGSPVSPVSSPISQALTLADPVVSGTATYTIYAVNSVTGCESLPEIVTVDVYAQPTSANAGMDVSQCDNSTFNMAANSGSVGTGNWSQLAGTAVTITDPSNATTTVTGLTPGNSATLRWTISNGSCPSSTDDVLIRNTTTPSSPIVTNQTQLICQGQGFSTPTTSGSNLQWYSDAALTSPIVTSDPTSPTSGELGFDNLIANTYRAYVTQSVDICESNVTEVTLIVNANPNTSLTVGFDQTVVCQGETIEVTIVNSQTGVNYELFDNFSNSISSVVAGTGSDIIIDTDFLTTTQTDIEVRAINSSTTCNSILTNESITVHALPGAPAISSSGSTVCDGANPDVTLISSLAPGPGSYRWYKDGVATGVVTQSIEISDPSSSGNYQVMIINGSTGCESSLSPVETVIIDNLPTPPLAGSDIEQCNTSTFTMSANTPIIGSASWSEVGGPAGITIDDPTSPTTSVTGLAAGSSATLRWTITNGSCVLTDDIIITNVLDPDVNPISNQELCAGDMTTAVTFSGNAANYSWTNSEPSIGLPASGTGNIAAFTALNSGGSPTIATIEVTPGIGSCSGISQMFTITVNPVPEIVPIGNISTGTGVSVGPIALDSNTGGGETYSWSGGVDVGLPDEPGASVTEIPAFTTTNSGTTTISRVVSVNAIKDGCTSSVEEFSITVFPIPGVVAGDQLICSNTFTNILITETVSGTTFNWTVSSVTGTVSGQSAGSGNLISQQLTSPDGGTVEYEIIPTASGIDGPPSYVTVQVEQKPVGNSMVTAPVCSGTALNISPGLTTSLPGTTFTWSGSNGSGGNGNITNAPTNSTTSQNIVTYTVTPTGPNPLNCVGNPFTIDVPVDPIPTITNTDLDDSFCGSGTANFNPSINVSSSSYSWDATILSGSVTGVTPGSVANSPVNELITNTGNSQAIVRYRITPTGPAPGSCVGNYVDYTVTINPTPDADANDQEICDGESTNIVITNPNGISGTTYSWTVGSVVGTVSGQSAGSGSVISQTLTSADGGEVEYIITPAFSGCIGTPISRTVRVDPIPIGADVGPGTYGVCSSQSITIDPDVHLTQGTAGTYFWTGSNGSGGSGNIIDTPINETSTSQIVTYSVVPVGPSPTNCFGTAFDIDVTVDPEPVGVNENIAVCSNSGGISYDLQNNIDSNNGVISTFSWSGSSNPNVTGITTITSTNGLINDNLINKTSFNQTVTYTITPSNGSCDGNDFTLQVIVEPEPVGVVLSGTVCSDEVIGTVFTLGTNGTSVSASSYEITGITIPAGIMASAGSPGTGVIGANGLIDDAWTNTTGVVENVIYTIEPSSSAGCVGDPFTVSVTVNPEPVVGVNLTQTVCSDVANTLTLPSTGDNGASINTYMISSSVGAGLSGTATSGATGSTNALQGDIFTNTTSASVDVVYTIVPVSATGCEGSSFTATLTVDPEPTGIATSGTVCSNDALGAGFNLSTVASGISATGFDIITITIPPGVSSISGSPSTGTGLASNVLEDDVWVNNNNNTETIVYEIVPAAGSCDGNSFNVSVAIQPQPIMSINNTAVELCSGSITDITLNTTTTNGIIRLDAISGTNANLISGKSSVGITLNDNDKIEDILINNTPSPITITYEFSVSANGCPDDVSPFTTSVTVNPNPDLTIVNAASEICSDDAVDISLNSSTDGHQINLVSVDYASGNVTGTGSEVIGGDIFTDGDIITDVLQNTTNIPQTVTYTFNVTTPGTTPDCPLSVANQIISVVVNPLPTMSINNVTPQICSGNITDITLNTLTVGGVIRLDAISGTNASDIQGKTSIGLTFVDGEKIQDNLLNSTNNPITITYEFSVTFDGCPDDALPFTTDVTVDPNPTFTVTNNSEEICSGESTDIDLNSPTTNAEIFIENVFYGGVTGGSLVPGSTFTSGSNITETLNNSTTGAIDVIYEFKVETTDGCPISPSPSQFATVTVSPEPSFNVTNNLSVICSEETTDIDISSPTTGAIIELINLTASSSIVGAPAIGSTYLNGANISRQITNTSNTSETIIFEFEVRLNSCVNPATQIISIDINPIPTLETSVDTQTICDGETTNILLTNPNNVAYTSYSWTVSPNSVGATSGSGTDIMQILSNSGNNPQDLTYTITPNANGCDGASKNVIVTVNPTPDLSTTGDETLCSGESTNIVLTNPNMVANTSFSWQVISNINGVSGASDGSGSVISQSLFVNNASPAGSVTYRISPRANNCDGMFEDVVVSVNPEPVVFAGFDYEICEDASGIELTASLTGAASSGTWTGGDNGSGFSNNPVTDGEVISYAFNQNDIDAGSVTFTLISDDPDGAGPCSSASDQITVTINSLPMVTFSGLPTEAAENDPLISLFGSPSGGIFSGDGISGNQFNPAGATVGVDNFVTYTYTEPSTGCTNSDTQAIFINGKPPIDIGNDNAEVCVDADPELLVANPTGGTWTGTGVVNIGGDDYEFRPSTAGVGTHVVTYTFTDINNATNSADLTFQVFPTPDVDFEPANLCFDEPIQFNDLTTIDQSVFAANLVDWTWQFFDEDDNIIGGSSLQNPSIIFSSPGEKRILLTVTSESGGFTCSSSSEKTITVGSVPDARFTWSNVCNGEFTSFVDDTNLDVGSIVDYEWDFDDGNIISGASGDPSVINHPDGSETRGTFDSTRHKYTQVGEFIVTLTVTTDAGCFQTYDQTVNILPQTAVDDFPYETNFDSDDANWAEQVELLRDESLISDNSWIYPSNGGSGEITPKYAGDNFWWTGGNNGSYYNNEQSWVNGPCLDFSQIERPMISMDILSSTDEGFDGTILQYSINGGVTWENVGALEEEGGINWYNSSTISAQPGNQSLGFGWTGKLMESEDGTLDWMRVSHNLNEVKGESNVLLRVAFGSNSDNSDEQLNGFAFDNVYIGEKRRLVLLEHFTDTEIDISNESNAYLENIQEDQLSEIGATDFTMLQYHIDDSGQDPFNQVNEGDPSARSIFYGVTQAPTTVMGGNQFNGNPFKINEIEIDRRSLEEPLFEVTIDTLASEEGVISAEVTIRALGPLSEQITVQLAVIESGLSYEGLTYNNVLRQLMLGGQGETLDLGWTEGTTRTIPAQWDINLEIVDPAQLQLVAFVQDKSTREVYGSALFDSPNKSGQTITSIDDSLLAQASSIDIYPNPVNGILNFAVQDKAFEDYNWKIVDQRGVTILEGDLDFEGGKYSVETHDLTNGIYYIVIGTEDKPLIYRKLAVANRR